MIRPIMRNQLFLAMPSEAATIEDAPVGQDLLDTLGAHAHECVGMAANMIGVRKRGACRLWGSGHVGGIARFACRIRMNRSKPVRKASVASLRRLSSTR